MDSNEQYTRALKRAQDEGVTICGDSIAPNGDRAWSVFNPKYEYHPDHSWYTVRLTAGSQHYTCNCQARTLCKHVALVMDGQAQQASRTAADLRRWTVDSYAHARAHNLPVPMALWQ